MKRKQKKIFVLVLLILASGYIHAQQQLSLQEVKSRALENNKRLKKAQSDINASKAANASAKAASKPTVDASVFGLYLSDPFKTLLPEYSANGSLALTQVIYAGNKIQTAKKMTGSAVDLQTSQKELTEDEVMLSAETAFWQVVSLKEKTALAQQYLKLLNALKKDLQNSFDAGLIYKNDLLKVEVQQNQAILDLTKANDGLAMAKLNLTQITGLYDTNFDIKGDLGDEAALVRQSDIKTAVERRPEIGMLNKAVEIQQYKGELLQGDQKPTLAVSANGLASYGKKINFSDGSDDMTAFVGLVTLSVPILDWGARKQKVKEQGFQTEARKIELEQTKELLAIEIQNAWLMLNQSVVQIELSNKSLQQSQENLRLNQDRFNAGTVLGEDVLEAQVLWQKAYSDLIDSKTGCRIAEAAYKKAIGEY
ncbi:TolC family protein [Flavobacterium pectinovorum]|uniref:TolC family protein n=1 Tax=Flavobacterium pectinovorum TaxID=29533 RepID=UPI001FAB7ED5|nr:TolC family protein [Flavobacterium pectinovorum]MCI9845575.1 TolC family protein [Flavobacterium pectinovorum]